jgi:single-strand DNA-binding protein
MAMELEGTLFKKFDTQKVKENFQKREFVMEIQDGSYPQRIKLELTQDKCGLIDSFQEGDKVKVSFNIRGSEWQGKYFVNLQAWRIDGQQSGGGTQPGNTYNPPPVEPENDGLGDDLPF